MILHLQIRTCSPLTLPDGGRLLQVHMVDASKPAALRSSATFETFLSPKKRSGLADGPLEDTDVTMLARDITPGKGGAIKLKGELVSGIKTIADMGKKFGGEATDFNEIEMSQADRPQPSQPNDKPEPAKS